MNLAVRKVMTEQRGNSSQGPNKLANVALNLMKNRDAQQNMASTLMAKSLAMKFGKQSTIQDDSAKNQNDSINTDEIYEQMNTDGLNSSEPKTNNSKSNSHKRKIGNSLMNMFHAKKRSLTLTKSNDEKFN